MIDIGRLWCSLGFFFVLMACSEQQQFEDHSEVEILRDAFGVPHIFGETDADVAYGLAWATCEDDFVTLQEQMLAIQGRLGQVKGKDGAIADFAIHFMGIRDYARRNLHLLGDETRKLISGYVSGVNAFAAVHAEEVLLKDAFPIKDYDLVAGYMMGLVEISGASNDLRSLADGSIVKELSDKGERGSNAIAIGSKITSDKKTYLAINSHQPMEGWYSWYEAHLVSKEGLNILGGTFPGGATIFHGVNEHLGWAHTVNHADFSDVYKLTMHTEQPYHYKYGNEYLPLKRKKIRVWVKLLGPIMIPITREVYQSRYGITFKIDDEYFAWKFQAGEAVFAIEQWYKMNKSENWEEFRSALSTHGIPCTNLVYADREDNIFYISLGKHHVKNGSVDYSGVIETNNHSESWSDEVWPLDSLPQVLNPEDAYVFNTNNTPFSSSSDQNDPEYYDRYNIMGYQHPGEENNRSLRIQELLDENEEISYPEFLDIKFDQHYPAELRSHPYREEGLFEVDVEENEAISQAIVALNNWDRKTGKESKTAPLFLLAREYLRQIYLKRGVVKSKDYQKAIQSAVEELEDKFGTIEVPLGEFQRHRRGGIDLPVGGGSDVLAAIYCREDTDGKYRAYSGESYIMMARFSKDSLPLIESINAYGASAEENSPHFTDQMELFANQQLKPMSLNITNVKTAAKTTYRPKRKVLN